MEEKKPLPRPVAKIAFADGVYTFCLPLAQVRELQEKCDAGLPTIAARLEMRSYRIPEDIVEPIRLGLIGGRDPEGREISPRQAVLLVDRYVACRPWEENRLNAWAVIMADLVGVPDDPIDTEDGSKKKTKTTTRPKASSTRKESSASRSSTDAERQSD